MATTKYQPAGASAFVDPTSPYVAVAYSTGGYGTYTFYFKQYNFNYVFSHWKLEVTWGSSSAHELIDLVQAELNLLDGSTDEEITFTGQPYQSDDPNASKYAYCNIKATAVFKLKQTYLITTVANPQNVGCKVKAGSDSARETTSSVTVTQGTSVEITATPNTDPQYIFVGWYENGSRRTWSKSFTVTADANHTYTAKFHLATNRLINRYSIATPVTLVYDDITGSNKLVADY